MSYEKFILDLDNCGAMLKMLNGMEVTEETLAARCLWRSRALARTSSQRLTRCATFASANFEPSVPEAGPYETWVENGSPTAAERAAIKAGRHMLASVSSNPAMDE